MNQRQLLLVFPYQDKRKRDELNSHINRLESLISQDQSELKAKEIISIISNQVPNDNEVYSHIEDVNALEKFEDIIRAQMLVSICGYFEYAVKRGLNQYQPITFTKKDGLKEVNNKLKKLGVIEYSVFYSLEEYRSIRNTCVHSNSISKEKNSKLASAKKVLTGIKLDHHIPAAIYKGKGIIMLEKEFLPEALSCHFDTLEKVHEFIIQNITKTL